MGVYLPPSVEDQPYVKIINWKVFELPDGERHVVGYIGIEGQGRVTSKIIDCSEDFELTTRSGRKYKLMGPPGYSADAMYVWNIWCEYNLIDPDAIDVSEFYCASTE